MRFALVIAAAGVFALGLASARGGGGDEATAAQAPLALRVAQLEAKVSGICTAFRTFDAKRSYHDYDASFQGLIVQLQQACGATRAARHEDRVKTTKTKKRVRHEDRPPPAAPPPPPHEG